MSSSHIALFALVQPFSVDRQSTCSRGESVMLAVFRFLHCQIFFFLHRSSRPISAQVDLGQASLCMMPEFVISV